MELGTAHTPESLLEGDIAKVALVKCCDALLIVALETQTTLHSWSGGGKSFT